MEGKHTPGPYRRVEVPVSADIHNAVVDDANEMYGALQYVLSVFKTADSEGCAYPLDSAAASRQDTAVREVRALLARIEGVE